MKKSFSTGALRSETLAAGSAAPVLGWAQSENAKRATGAGPPTWTESDELSPKGQKMEAAFPTLLLDLQSKLGDKACQNGTGWVRLCVSVAVNLLSTAAIYGLPYWQTTPFFWFLGGTSLFGLNAVAVSCANNTFCEVRIVNHVVGWLCSAVLLVPFEAWTLHSETAVWRLQERNFLRTMSNSRFWIFSSFAEWGRSQVSLYINKKRVLGNLAAMWAGYAVILPLLVNWLGVSGFFKYFAAPWLVYHIWRSIAIKAKFASSHENLDQASVLDLLGAFSDEYPDQKMSFPVVSKLLFETHKTFRTSVSCSMRILEKMFGWETFSSFPLSAVGMWDPNSPRKTQGRGNRQRSVSSVFSDDQTGLFAQFGGQGADYFDELLTAYSGAAAPVSALDTSSKNTNKQQLARRLIEAVSDVLKKAVASPEAQALNLHEQGMDLIKWLDSEDIGSRPTVKYLRSAPVSYPLIGLTQLANYADTLDRLNVSPGDFRARLKGTTGHSQGVVSAVVIASSGTREEFVKRGCEMVEYLFWHGARMQQVANSEVLKGEAVRPATELTQPPTPMLAVNGLPVELVAKLLSRAALSSKVEISLVNSETSVVLSGEPASLALLQSKLLQQQTQSAPVPRSAIPFYKRKPVVATRFLNVTAPFHFSRMENAEKLILEDVKRMGLTMMASHLSIPVYATDGHGRDIRHTCSSSSDVMPLLIAMQATKAVQWPAALAHANTTAGNVTHILDFGPGGTRGSAMLTRRVLADRIEELPVILASQHHAVSSDDTEGVFGLDTFIGDQGGDADTVFKSQKNSLMRKSRSMPVLSNSAQIIFQQRQQVQKRIAELDSHKMSLSDFTKLSGTPRSPRFKDKHVTFVTD